MSLSLILPALMGVGSGFKSISEQHATGIGLNLGGFFERLHSPQFWVLAVLLFALFLVTSRLGNRVLRTVLFWLPANLSVMLGPTIAATLACASLALRAR